MSIGKRSGLLVLTALLTGLMVWMGVWQLSRADEKRQLLQEWQQRSQIELKLDEALTMSSPFGYRLQVSGVFLAGGEVFLDNQIEQGRPGYRLIRPLQTPQGLLAVDWGWLPAAGDRRQLPQVAALDDTLVVVSGALVRPWQPPLTLGRGEPDPQSRRVASLAPELLASHWGQPVLPMVLKTDTEGSWRPVVMGPEKHQGYALQWFAMAGAIWLAAWWWNGRRE